MSIAISVIVPTYNEKDAIGKVIEDLSQVLHETAYEIVVVDDASPDGTAEHVERLQNAHVQVIRRSGERGLALSIYDGLCHASGQTLVVMDADGTHDSRCIPHMMTLLSSSTLVSASRFLLSGGMPSGISILLRKIFNWFARVLLGTDMTDHTFGFFAMRKELFQACPTHAIFTGYGEYFMKLCWYVNKKSLSIKECPSVHCQRYAGKSKSNKMAMMLTYITVLCDKGWRTQCMKQ